MSKVNQPGRSNRPRLYPSLSAIVLLSVMAAGCASAPPVSSVEARTGAGSIAVAPEGTVFPGAEWERVESPESVGWCTAGLDRLREDLESVDSKAFMATVGGRVLFEYGDTRTVSYIASVRKSVISILYGIYHDRGQIDLTRTLADLGIDDHQGLTDAEKRATIRDLLMARSGVYHPASNSGDNLSDAPERGSKEPGEYYLYSNWDFNALGTIFEQETNSNIYDTLERDLVRPLGMQDFDRSLHRRTGNRKKSQHLAYHMHFSTRDMSRVGYLMLRNGNWDGNQIVSPEWVRESTSALTPVHEMNPSRRRNDRFGYGYLWWVFDRPELGPEFEGAFSGHGYRGQHIVVMPALDLVIAHKTVLDGGKRVSHARFYRIVDLLLQARCSQSAAN